MAHVRPWDQQYKINQHATVERKFSDCLRLNYFTNRRIAAANSFRQVGNFHGLGNRLQSQIQVER